MAVESGGNKSALIKLSQFVLDAEAEQMRNVLQEKIVETALYWGLKEDEFASPNKINELIASEIRLISFLPSMLIEILARLKAKGAVVDDGTGAFKLTEFQRKELEVLVNDKRKTIDQINNQFLSLLEKEYGKRLTDEQKKECLEKFYDLLSSLALEKSDLVARIITQKDTENLPMELSIHKLSAILGKIEDANLRNAEFRTIKQIFKENTYDFYDFLFSLTQNLMCIQILNLDPDCQALEKRAFADKTLFLDTNMIIALVCPTDWQHDAALTIMNLSKSLGVKICVAKRTCDEYVSTIEEANRLFRQWQAPLKFLEDTDNKFLASFWSEKQKDQSLSWNNYYERNVDIGKILQNLGIELNVENMNKLREDTHFKDIVTQVNQCYLLVKNKGKGFQVCEHDALLMLHIRELRKKQTNTLIGPNYWFITEDESLLCVDNKINSIPQVFDKIPSSVLSDVWLEMITPFLPLTTRRGEAYEAFTVLVKNQFALVPFQIDAQTLIKIQGNWTKYEWLDAPDIIRIQNQAWTKSFLRQLESAKKKEDKNRVEELGTAFSRKLEAELQRIADEKVKKLIVENKVLSENKQALIEKLSTTEAEKMEEITKREEQIKQRQEVIKQKDQIIESKDIEINREIQFKRKLRVVATIAGLFLVFSPLIIWVVKALPIVPETTIYFGTSLLVGAILLYFGIAPERANVSLAGNISVTK